MSKSKLLLSDEASVDIFACSVLLGTTMVVAYVAKKRQWVYFPESSAALVLGMLFGAIARWLLNDIAFTFRPEVFFFGLLPIIIFNAGYALRKKDFFRNFSTIVLLAVVGTVISTLVYGVATYTLYKVGVVKHLNPDSPLVESLIFGSLISAIDPVATLSIFQDVHAPTLLYNLVFGESLVNDAVSIVLFRTFSSFYDEEFTSKSIPLVILQFLGISFGSIILGLLVSLGCARILKAVDVHSEYAKFEISFVLISAYVAYSVAELVSLSGIMSLFFCGICNAHYGYYNTSHASKISSKYAFEALSYMAELFVFAYLGMQVVVVDHVYDWGLLVSSLPLCLLARACNVFPLTLLADAMGNKTPASMKVMMWLSGLRGAIAFALAVNMPGENKALITTTLFIVVVTTILFGGATAPLLHALGLVTPGGSHSLSHLDMPLLSGRSFNDLLVHPRSSPQLGARPTIHSSFKWIDHHYLKPLFGGQRHVLDEQQPEDIRAATADKTMYHGIGFSFSVPEDWIEYIPSVFEDSTMVKFTAPDHTRHGDPVAEADVLCLSNVLEASSFPDPMAFLIGNWESIFPELQGDSKPLDIAGQVQRSMSINSESSVTRSGSISSPPTKVTSYLNSSSESLLAQHALPSASSQIIIPKVRSSSLKDSPSTPAFVVWAEELLLSENKMFRFEVVFHPADLGDSKGEIRHCLLSAAWSSSGVYVCRVAGTESYFFEQRPLMKSVVDSFTLSDVA